MKTKGITHALALNALFALTHLTAIPVSAQVNFASQNSISFSGQDKISAISSLNYYSAAEPVARLRHSSAPVFYSSSPEKNSNADKEIIYTEDVVNKSLNTANLNYTDATNLRISFKPTSFTYPASSKKDVGIAEYPTTQLLLYAIALKQYAKKYNYDTTYVFLSNMGMLSAKKRFFVVNLVTMQVEQSGLVSQGRGQGRSRYDKQYSNIEGSKCTSLGRYKIMKKYKGEFGEAYRLFGLDSSNKNAFNRSIVLHSMGCIPDEEDIMPTCISEGCPAVSVKFLSYLYKIIDSRKKPILLWVFDSNLEEAVVETRPVQNSISEPVNIEGKGYHSCSIHSHNNPGMLLP